MECKRNSSVFCLKVSAQQQVMDRKFAAMHRTVCLLRKYEQTLPELTQKLFDVAPGRWSNLKSKVSLARQRLGPRIQEESDRITKVRGKQPRTTRVSQSEWTYPVLKTEFFPRNSWARCLTVFLLLNIWLKRTLQVSYNKPKVCIWGCNICCPFSQYLAAFGERVLTLQEEMKHSDVYSRHCSIGDSWVTINDFVQWLDVLEKEAQDLIELQELLESSVLNFSILPQWVQCRSFHLSV